MYSRKEIKLESRRIIKERGISLKWCVAVFLILSITLSQLMLYISGYHDYSDRVAQASDEYYTVLEQYIETGDSALLDEMDAKMAKYDKALESFPRVSTTAGLIVLLLLIMSLFLSAGFEWWCLLNSRRQPNSFRSMFDGFGFPFKLLLLRVVEGLLIFAGVLLFIIPGIYLALAFSQSTYILFEDPSQSIGRCLRKSMQIMKGYKWKYLGMLFSFLGWEMLGLIIAFYINIILSICNLEMITAYSSIAFGIWLTPYSGITRAGFYNYITGYTVAAEQEPVQHSQEDNTL